MLFTFRRGSLPSREHCFFFIFFVDLLRLPPQIHGYHLCMNKDKRLIQTCLERSRSSRSDLSRPRAENVEPSLEYETATFLVPHNSSEEKRNHPKHISKSAPSAKRTKDQRNDGDRETFCTLKPVTESGTPCASSPKTCALRAPAPYSRRKTSA